MGNKDFEDFLKKDATDSSIDDDNKRKIGRTNFYEEVVSKQLQQVTDWKMSGLSNEQIAVNLGIDRSTFYTYLLKHQDFLDAVEKGKAVMISELENSAFKSATGHKVIETKVEQDYEGKTKITKTEKYIPPNPAQNIFMLKNLMSNKYKDRIETTNTVNVNIRQIQNLSDEELLKIANIVEIPIDYEIE